MDILKENTTTILYGVMGIALVILLAFLYKQKGAARTNRRRSREGFQATAPTEEGEKKMTVPVDYVIDKNVVCPTLLETLKAQLKQREAIVNLPVDITKTAEFQQIIQMIQLSHKNMLELQCPDIPSLPAM
jgi:hypothetical protein